MLMLQTGSTGASTKVPHEASPRLGEGGAGKVANEIIMVAVRGQLLRDGIQSLLQSPGRTVIGSCDTLDQIAADLDAMPQPGLFVVGGYGMDHLAELCSGIQELRSKVPSARWLFLSPNIEP